MNVKSHSVTIHKIVTSITQVRISVEFGEL